MKLSLVILTLVFCFFSSCSIKEDALFNEDEATPISVEAFVLHIGDSTSSRYRTDTLFPSDSIILMASIEPSKSIRITSYYWEMDSNKISTEFSYRTQIQKPGAHKIKFVLLDRFADTLTDSLNIWIVPAPILNTSYYIPRSGSQLTDNVSEMHFAWFAKSENPLSKLKFHFTLKSIDSLYVDTILSSPQYSYKSELPEFQKMTWTVSASDNFNRKAKDSIIANFYTNCKTTKSGIVANIVNSHSNILENISFSLLNSSDSLLNNSDLSYKFNNQNFSLTDLNPGNYKIFFYNKKYTDYKSDTIKFYAKENEVNDLGNISFKDDIKPKIHCLNCSNDSIQWNDSLLFEISDKGLPITASDISITFDAKNIKNWNIEDGKLVIKTAGLTKSFIWIPLQIDVYDNEKNYIKKTFFISPGKSCIETLSDTTVSGAFSIKIPIKNTCKELTPKRFFWDIDDCGSWEGEAAWDRSDSVSKTFSSTLFPSNGGKVNVIILYENGISLTSSFKLSIKGSE